MKKISNNNNQIFYRVFFCKILIKYLYLNMIIEIIWIVQNFNNNKQRWIINNYKKVNTRAVSYSESL